MSVKTTIDLTRAEAINRLLDLRAQVVLTDKELEDELERMNDLAHGGEGFESYRVGSRRYPQEET